MQLRILVPIAFILAFLGACSSMLNIPSVTADGPVAIDGDDADWAGKTWYVESEQASVGFQHYGDLLYVFFKTGDPGTQRQILRGGLTVWIDAEGGSGENLGIRYPTRPAGGPDMMRGRTGEHGMDDAEAPRITRDAVRECEILGADEKDLRIAPLHKSGIDAMLSMKAGILIYEMQIPMNGHKDITVPRPSEGGLGIGFTTALPDRDRPRDRDDMDRPEDGLGDRPGGMGAGMPGGGTGGRRPGNPQSMHSTVSPLELWIKVKMEGR